MKLRPEWKQFYLNCLDIPLIGRGLLGPALRLLWKGLSRLPEQGPPPALADTSLVATLAATIDGQRRLIDTLNARVAELEARQREPGGPAADDTRAALLAASLQGLGERLDALEQRQQHHDALILAALEGVLQRDAAPPMTQPLPGPESAGQRGPTP